MLVLTCGRDTLVDIGENIKVRVVSIRKESVELEIDAPGDTRLEPDVICFERARRNLSPEHLAPTRS